MDKLSNKRYEVLDEQVMEQIASSDDQGSYLVLENHPDFPGQWIVNCLDPAFYFDFADTIGPYRAVSPIGLRDFLDLCDSLSYRVVFANDPASILDAVTHLNDRPAFPLLSNVPGTVEGYYPWQLQGFNFLKDLPGGKAIWSTGTGKTALAAALIKYHLDQGNSNLAFYLAKAHNKVNTQRKLKQLAGVDSVVLDAPTPPERAHLYAELYTKIHNGERLVLITNYEKFRDDEEAFKILVENQDTLFIWDEMPTRLSNRTTKLYEAVQRIIWKTAKDTPTSVPNPLKSKFRVKSYRGYELTATPIENDPEGDYNCTRLIRPEAFGPVQAFRDEYVLRYNFFNEDKPEAFHKLDKMALKQAHFTHVVNKKDPDIAKFFPRINYEPILIDWHSPHRKVYDMLTGKAKKALENFDEINVLSMISTLQMLCDAPSMITESSRQRSNYVNELERFIEGESDHEPTKRGSELAWELTGLVGALQNDQHTKLETLRDLIVNKHGDEKILCYTVFGPMLLPILSEYLTEWEVPHVVYAGTPKQKQVAQDRFLTDDDVRLFLSSDAGADSIDLEVATVGIDYDLPWKYTTRVQRWNRANRAGAGHDYQTFYSLLMANSVEHRRLEIIEKKQGYHEAVYEGKLNEVAASSRMTREDLLYILGG